MAFIKSSAVLPGQVLLNPDEVEVVKALINDWGFEYSLKAKREDVAKLARALGMNREAAELSD